jgi:hypothetical protein
MNFSGLNVRRFLGVFRQMKKAVFLQKSTFGGGEELFFCLIKPL